MPAIRAKHPNVDSSRRPFGLFSLRTCRAFDVYLNILSCPVGLRRSMNSLTYAAETAPLTEVPKAPETVADVGVPRAILEDLALKNLYVTGSSSLRDLAKKMRLTFRVIDELFRRLRTDQLCEV